jgi:hypothetical protein
MDNLAEIFITLGALFLLGLLTDLIGRHTPLPTWPRSSSRSGPCSCWVC